MNLQGHSKKVIRDRRHVDVDVDVEHERGEVLSINSKRDMRRHSAWPKTSSRRPADLQPCRRGSINLWL